MSEYVCDLFNLNHLECVCRCHHRRQMGHRLGRRHRHHQMGPRPGRHHHRQMERSRQPQRPHRLHSRRLRRCHRRRRHPLPCRPLLHRRHSPRWQRQRGRRRPSERHSDANSATPTRRILDLRSWDSAQVRQDLPFRIGLQLSSFLIATLKVVQKCSKWFRLDMYPRL